MSDPHNLQRFIDAQAPVYDAVVSELRAASKRTHWMWFIFPQLAGLGRSSTARHFALASLDEARAYLAHPLLGARLRECVGLIMGPHARSASTIFGSPDDMKLHSSLTLFARAAPQETLFADALARFFGGQPDAATLALLGKEGEAG